jgi:hypothetical protein
MDLGGTLVGLVPIFQLIATEIAVHEAPVTVSARTGMPRGASVSPLRTAAAVPIVGKSRHQPSHDL